MEKVIKRDRKQVPFDTDKIKVALRKANSEVPKKHRITEDEIESIVSTVANLPQKAIGVEGIQDIITNKLVSMNKPELVTTYITYRYKHKLRRDANTTDDVIFELLGGTSEYWSTENSNKNAQIVTTQRDYIAGISSKDISSRLLLPEEVVKADKEGIIHFHDMDYFAQNSLHNCFTGSTEFITDQGVRRFDSFEDGTSVKVIDKDGVWRTATVHSYGKQAMFDITLTSGKTIKQVTATSNHRWILKDGTVTTKLSVGDRLWLTPQLSHSVDVDNLSEEESRYFALGFILGDGTDSSHKGVYCRLCGNKIKYLPIFQKAGYKFSQVKNTQDIQVSNKNEYSKQQFLSSSAWKLLSSKQKELIFLGLYAADGNAQANKLSTADVRIAALVEELSAIAGYHIQSKTEMVHDTNFKTSAYLLTFTFMIDQVANKNWIVKEIKPHYNKQYPYYNKARTDMRIVNTPVKCWCIEEPVTHSFTLAGGIVTGNCDLINLEDMLQNGTTINGVRINRPNWISKAATIATQIITAVASSQYGGCTVTLTHLAPFVRDSYNKYLEKYKNRLILKQTVTTQDYEDCIKFAKEDLAAEIESAVQTFNYQINSMSTTNGQAPFISIMMYLNETSEYKEELAMLISEFLKQRIIGMQNSEGVYVTPAFPKLLYVLEEDNISEDRPYYYLTELAAKCTAKRLVPDYISEKVMIREKYGFDNKTGLVVPGYEEVFKKFMLTRGYSSSDIEKQIKFELELQSFKGGNL